MARLSLRRPADTQRLAVVVALLAALLGAVLVVQSGRAPATPRFVIAAEAGSTVPARLARVTEAKFAASPSLGPPGAGPVFVTAAEDIEGISTSQGLAERLTLLDDAWKLREGPFAVTTFDTPAEGLGVPVFRTKPGFVRGGFTQGGAREFDLDNLLYKELGNVEQRIVP